MAKKFDITTGIKLTGEQQFKKAISSINSDMRVLGSELTKCAAKYSGNANKMDALTAKGKLLADNQEKQKQKVDILKQALDKAKQAYGENDTRVDAYKVQLNRAETQLTKLNDEIDINKKALTEAKGSFHKTAKSVDEYGKKVSGASEKSERFKTALKANLTGAAVVAGVKTLTSNVRKLGESLVNCATDAMTYADDILTLSAQTGVSTKKLQEFKYMEELVDVSTGTITKSMAKNIKSMKSAADGSKTAAEAYKKLGVNVKDSHGKLKNSNTVYWDCVDALGKMKNSSERDATAMTIFGKSAQALNPMIKKGSKGMKGLAKEANNMGAVMSGKALDSLGEADDATQRMNQSMEILKRQIGAKLAPTVMDLSKKFTSFCQDNGDEIADFVENGIDKLVEGLTWCKDNWKGIATGAGLFIAALAIGKVTNFVNTMVTGFRNIKAAIDAAKTSQVVLNAVQAASPTGIVLGLAAAVGAVAIAYANVKSNESKMKYGELTTKQKKLTDEINKSADSYREIKDARKDTFESADVEETKNKRLLKKLDSLIDKNGKLKDGKKKQAKFITGELSKSLNTEIKMQDILAGRYSKVKKRILGVIEAQKRKAIWEANKDNYTKALKEEQNSANKYKEQLDEYNNQAYLLSKLKEKRSNNTKVKKQSNPLFLEWWGAKFNGVTIDEDISNAQSKLKKLKEELIKSEKTYVGFQATISNHEKLTEAIADGNAKNINKALHAVRSNLVSCSNGTKSTLKQQVEDTKKNYDTLNVLYKDSNNKDKIEKLQIAKENYTYAVEQNKLFIKEQKKSGKISASSLASGVKSKKGEVKRAFKETGKAGKDGFDEVNYKESGESAVDEVTSAAKKKQEEMKSTFESLAKYASQGFLPVFERSIKNSKVFQLIPAKARKDMGINSPSKKFMEIGDYCGQGYEIGAKKSFSRAVRTTNEELSKISNGTYAKNVTIDSKVSSAGVESVNEDAISNIGSGDLNLTLKLDGNTVYESSYKEFRKRKMSDPKLSWA